MITSRKYTILMSCAAVVALATIITIWAVTRRTHRRKTSSVELPACSVKKSPSPFREISSKHSSQSTVASATAVERLGNAEAECDEGLVLDRGCAPVSENAPPECIVFADAKMFSSQVYS
eukprot:Gregarina_sp_Poly_1__9022@NODE_54_length_17501_cov_44_565045_g46_i0_p11_GENE_NODE_54_length_17501_cov_44_565045_g46_i0NODE_54_length_17501_cov_44_565045_g46_i0_p11_ORF_typecomplete_len120_score7_24Herpes_gE/PF02480_16/0_059Alpha_GJ/PF03229_13/0_42Alpha_GJ/PF03229_13/7e02_NODE_54_length_17501_cov_44_565045_g46_i029213280